MTTRGITTTEFSLGLAVLALVVFIVAWVLRPDSAPDPLPSQTPSTSVTVKT